jgi:hypothetical protein
MTEMLPFDVNVQVPLSAICANGTPQMMGHRIVISTNKRTKRIRKVCKQCRMLIEHDATVGAYVTPFVIQEEPW